MEIQNGIIAAALESGQIPLPAMASFKWLRYAEAICFRLRQPEQTILGLPSR
jgi:hypothetical protein